jgi:hypothetical protein
MAQQRNPNESFSDRPTTDNLRPTNRLDQMQSGNGLPDNRITSSRLILAAVAVAILLGGLLYGVSMSSNSSTSTATQSPTTTTGSATTPTPDNSSSSRSR